MASLLKRATLLQASTQLPPSVQTVAGLNTAGQLGKAVSTDGTYSLPAPTGGGLEMVIATVSGAPGLQDIRFNGVSL